MGPGVKNCVRQKTPIKCNNPLTVHRLYPCQIPWYHTHLFTLRRIEYVTHSHFYNLECTMGVHQFGTDSSVSESIRNFRIVPSFRIYTEFQNAVLSFRRPFLFQNRVWNFRMPFYFQNVVLSFRIAFQFQKTVFVSESRWHLWATVPIQLTAALRLSSDKKLKAFSD